MSTIYRDANGNPSDSYYPVTDQDKCNICGGIPDAHWRGRGDIWICGECAVDRLPRLIADAIRAHSRDTNQFFAYEKSMRLAYWQAAAVALARKPVKAD